MKNRTTIFWVLSVIFFLFSCSMSPDDNLDFVPPSENSKAEDVFPEKIDGNTGLVENPLYGGIEVNYGDAGSIYVVRLENEEEAISFFQNNLLDDFKDLPNNFSGNINGQYYANAHSKTKWIFGWVNENYVFTIEADSEEELEVLVEEFDYISLK